MRLLSPVKRDVLGAAILSLLSVAIYAGSLTVGFYSDDFQWLGRMNPTLERPGFLFTVIYRDFNPVLHASFLLDWVLGGGSGIAFHAQSLAIHGLNTGLLLLLCRRLEVPLGIAALATPLWAWNVRVSEAVIWPAARGHALATSFVLLALLVVGSRFRGRAVLALALWVAGLLAKETALFPLVLLPFFVPEPRRAWRLYTAFGTLAAVFVAFNFLAKPSFHTSEAGPSFLALKVPFILLRPLGLGDQYDFGWAAFGLVLLAFAGAAWTLRRGVGILGLAWVAACLVPIVPLEKLSSRYLYMLAVGYVLVACGVLMLLERLARRLAIGRRLRAALAVVLLPLYAVNVAAIQREIEDYRILGEPYAACVQVLAPVLRTLRPGDTVTVVDLGPHDTVERLAERIRSRGNMRKLMPYRPHGVGGLIALDDLINVGRPRAPGILGYGVREPDAATPRLWVLYDGERAVEIRPLPEDAVDPRRLFHARWADSSGYFR